MSNSHAEAPRARYPGPPNTNETIRLRAQHNIVVSALGGLVLCPVDLSKENFQALDSGTADGYFLYALRKELKHPESATLIGTDINSYPDTLTDLPPGTIKIQKHNFLDAWPSEWEGKFDFIQQRAAMANVPDSNQAVDVAQRLIKLLKPGGWIQLVDGQMLTGDLSADDLPSVKMWKCIGRFLASHGLDPMQGTKVKDILAATKGVQNLESRTGVSVLGKGCAAGLEEDSYTEFRGLRDSLIPGFQKSPHPPVTPEELAVIIDDTMEEARTKGVEMTWHAAWAQRVE